MKSRESSSSGDELMATVGTEPQIITLTLDALLEKRCPIDRVSVFHTDKSGRVMSDSLLKLEAMRSYYSSLSRPITLEFVPFADEGGQPIADIFSDGEEKAVEGTFYREIARAKREGRRVHLLPIGGYTDLALMALPMAQLLFDADDYCWSMRSSPSLLQSKRMRATEVGDTITLKQKKVINWSADVRAVFALDRAQSAQDAVALQKQWLEDEALRRRREFLLSSLTKGERIVFLWLGLTGGDWPDLARRQFVSPKTVSNHYDRACDKYKAFYKVPPGTRLKRSVLALEFSSLAHSWNGDELNGLR